MHAAPHFEVTVPAAAGEPRWLTTAANVRAMIGTPDTEDATLEAIIDRASGVIAAHCGLALDPGTDFPTFGAETCRATWYADHLSHHRDRGRPAPLILPWRKPITVTTVVENGIDLVAGTDFVLEQSGLLFRLRGGEQRTSWCASKVVVVYQAGYSLPTSVPPDLESAAIEQVKHLYMSRRRDDSIRSETVPDVYQASYSVAGGDSIGANGLLLSVAGKLERFERPGSL